VEYAESERIELREFAVLTPEEVYSWLQLSTFKFLNNLHDLRNLRLFAHSSAPEGACEALKRAVSNKDEGRLLWSIKKNQYISPADAFISAVSEIPDSFQDLTPNGPAKTVELRVEYVGENDHFVVVTDIGNVRIGAIEYRGYILIKEEEVPLAYLGEYRAPRGEKAISQVASFEPKNFGFGEVAIEIHRFVESGKGQVVLRRVK
jgi:hypothetical protein